MPACDALPGRSAEGDLARLSYRDQVERFQKGKIGEKEFRAIQAAVGVYEQRQSATYMVRVRLGAGLASARQLVAMARLSTLFGRGDVHFTTRQDVQIHDVSLDGTVALVEAVEHRGLSTRGSGGNTVRNVTACPRASVCAGAGFDVTPCVVNLAEYFSTVSRPHPLPRKFKIAFSGCGKDCASASVSDLGFFAHRREGLLGFSVYAGGGFGQNSAAAVLVEDFVPLWDVPLVAEAVVRLFDRLGDWNNRARARLRYVLARLGSETFIAEYRKERAALETDFTVPSASLERLAGDSPAPTNGPQSVEEGEIPRGFLPERNRGLLTAHVQLRNGNSSALDLVRVARIARGLGNGVVVATQQQDLLLLGIGADRVADAQAALAKLSFVCEPSLPKVVACTGASTCKPGICQSQALADAVTERLRGLASERTSEPSTIRISGCPNGCGGHSIAALGFEGRARRCGNRLLPMYEVVAGGKTAEGEVRLSQRLGLVPEQVIPDFVAEIYAKRLTAPDELRPVVQRFAQTETKE
jgi:sulfite reductase (ferredoxin)